jgi:hypothetical protein
VAGGNAIARPRDLPKFKWINTTLGDPKTMLAGTFHLLNCRKQAQTYLAAFTYLSLTCQVPDD